MKPQNLITIAVAAFSLVAIHAVNAGQVTGLTTFQPNTPAKAAEVNGNFTALQNAVNDNASGGVKGALITMFGGSQIFGNLASDNSGYSGYYPLAPVAANSTPSNPTNPPTSSFTLPVGVTSAVAYVQTTCAFDGDLNKASPQSLQQQAAMRTPANPGNFGNIINVNAGPITGDASFNMPTGVPASSVMVQNSSFEIFDLSPNVNYDFGVWFVQQTPYGTANNGYCSISVAVYRQ